MVQCDKCDMWNHYTCVGVSHEIAEVEWLCPKCTVMTINSVEVQQKNVSIAQSSKSRQTDSTVRRRNIELKMLEEQRLLAARQDEETLRYLEEERTLAAQRDAKYIQEKKKASIVAANRDAEQLKKKYELLAQGDSEEEVEYEDQYYERNKMTKDWLVNVPSVPTNVTKNEYLSSDNFSDTFHNIKISPHQQAESQKEKLNYSFPKLNRQHSIRDLTGHFPNPAPKENYSRPMLTQDHIAARHVLSKDLPSFNGRPEEWPLFISEYNDSTAICSYSSNENLSRLRKCLKGKALEAVRSKLLLPVNVPNIIETLRVLYGRPEIIIHNLMQQIRNEPSPKSDRFDSLLKFALVVENLVATIEASGLMAHMNNPSLLQEITDKLPTQVKWNWAMYKQTIESVNLSTMAHWLFEVSKAASDVTMPSQNYYSPENNSDSKRDKAFLHTHSEQRSARQSDKKNSSEKRERTCFACNIPNHETVNCKLFINSSLNDKWNTVRENKLCGRCLLQHRKFQCKVDKVCSEPGCERKHHPLLHKQKVLNENNTNTPCTPADCNTHHAKNESLLFRIVPVTLYGKVKTVDTYAFLDEGSSLTLIEQSTADSLGLQGTAEPLCLKWTAETVRTEYNSKIISLSISGQYQMPKKYAISNVRTVEKLSLPVQSVKFADLAAKYPYLNEAPVKEYQNAVPKILIGLDNWKLGMPLDRKEGSWREPVATQTRLGWTVHGFYKCKNEIPCRDYDYSFHMCSCNVDIDLHQLVKDYFSLESFGVSKPKIELQSVENERAINILNSTVSRVGMRYESGLLWKFDDVRLPDSYQMAKKRMLCLEKRLSKDENMMRNLQNQMMEYVSKGYIKKLSVAETLHKTPKTWYLPIFAVTNPNKPSKVRIVWDAAAKVNGVSLNSVLLKGPDNLTYLPDVLYRFRERRVAICGDIKEMFHQVKVQEQDQQSQRFLWRNVPSDTPSTYVMQVMTFGASCSPSVAQYVKNRNAENYEKEFPRAALAIKENHYVDDFIDCQDTIEQAIQLAKEVKFIHSQVGFQMRNWVSNAQEVLQLLGEENSNDQKNFSDATEEKIEKILGMWWCTETDFFTYSLKYNRTNKDVLTGKRKPTKREVLRILMSVFDPLGLIAFFMVYAKILLQEIWRTNTDWDDIIPDKLQEKWDKWIQLLPNVSQVKIGRCYSPVTRPEDLKSIELHVFVDASENAFAAVAYFRIECTNGVQCVLIGAKTRVAPLAPLSIPRLELQAAVIGTRLSNSILKAHSIKVTKRIMWSDSQTVLSWLRSDQRNYKQFVAHRIGEILETTNAIEWRWIPTKLNVADEATKWQSCPNFEGGNRWFNGPEFLYFPAEKWPNDHTKNVVVTTEEDLRHHLVHQEFHCNPIMKFERFSNWLRLVHTRAYVSRFIKNLKAHIRKLPKVFGPLNRDEYIQAENDLFRESQNNHFPDEMSVLKQNATLLPSDKKIQIEKSSNIYNRSPFLDSNGIIRTGGRLVFATGIEDDAKHPIILSKNSALTKIILWHYHRKLFHHHNHETVVNEVRQKFDITALRVCLKKVVNECQLCKNSKAMPMNPKMANLPPARLSSFTRPFSFVGVDYFGPMTVTYGRRTEKRWGVLFTCLTIRAVHLEIAHSLNTDSCIMCIRNFMSRRGQPVEFFSDNGTNFRGADNELSLEFKKMNMDAIQSEFTNRLTKWQFNPPASPHMGGSWERLVRSVKTTLKMIMPTRNPNDELLRAMLMECENVVNSRPLTFVPVNSDTEEALTPNHFLLGSSSGIANIGPYSDDVMVLKKNWKKSQNLADHFWRRWIREYLPTITRRTKWFQDVKPIAKGDIVIIVDENCPRNNWPKGIVVETIPGKDGQVRKATIKTASGYLIRPAVKLAVLDVIDKPIEFDLPGGSVDDGTLK